MYDFFDEEDYLEFKMDALQRLEGSETLILESEKQQSFSVHYEELIRNFHTLKGNSMILGISDLANLLHHLEDLLCAIRDGKTRGSDFNTIVDLLLYNTDYIKDVIEHNDMKPDPAVVKKHIIQIKRLLRQGG